MRLAFDSATTYQLEGLCVWRLGSLQLFLTLARYLLLCWRNWLNKFGLDPSKELISQQFLNDRL